MTADQQQTTAKTYTTSEALKELRMSRPTFLQRMRALQIKPLNFNPNLLQTSKSIWSADAVQKAKDYAAQRRAEAEAQHSA